jgi:hypothetical protein
MRLTHGGSLTFSPLHKDVAGISVLLKGSMAFPFSRTIFIPALVPKEKMWYLPWLKIHPEMGWPWEGFKERKGS